MNERINKLMIFLAGAIISFALVRMYDAQIKAIEWRDSQVGMYITIEWSEIKKPEPILEPETDIDRVVAKVRILESSNGTAGLALTCKNRGLSNEYGYNPSTCYKSHEHLTNIVKDWFSRKLAVMSLEESLCLYNLGIQTDSCDYVNKFNSL